MMSHETPPGPDNAGDVTGRTTPAETSRPVLTPVDRADDSRKLKINIEIPGHITAGLTTGGLIGLPLGFVLLLTDNVKDTDGSFGFGVAAIVGSTAALVAAALGRRKK